MDVFAVDATSGREFYVTVDADDTFAVLKSRCAQEMGYEEEEDLSVSPPGGDPINAPDTDRVSDLESLASGCRLEVCPTGQRFVADLREGRRTLQSLPDWARLQPACVCAALSAWRQTDREIYVPPELWGDAEVLLAALRRKHTWMFHAKPQLLADRAFAAAATNECPTTAYWLVDPALRLERDYAQQVVRACAELAHLPECYWGDRDLFLAATARSGPWHLRLAPTLRGDREALLAAVARNPEGLQLASPELRADRDVLLAAARTRGRQAGTSSCSGGCGLRFASPEALADLDIMSAVVQASPGCGRHASPAVRSSTAFALRALVSGHGCPLKYIPDAALRSDREVVLAAVKRGALCSSHPLLQDKDFVAAALPHNSNLFRRASAALRADRDLVMQAVGLDGHLLGDASSDLQADPEVVRAALSGRSPARLSMARGAAKRDRELVLLAVRRDSDNFRHASDALRRDREVVLAAVAGDACLRGWLDADLRDDPEVVAACGSDSGVAHHRCCDEEGEPRADDKAAVLEAVIYDACYFERASPALQRDPVVAAAAVRGDQRIYWRLPEALRSDAGVAGAAAACGTSLRDLHEEAQGIPSVVREAMSHRSEEYMFASDALRADRAFALATLPSHGRALRHAAAALRDDEELVRAVVANHPDALRAASPRLRADRALALAAVTSDGELLGCVGAMCADREVALAALLQCSASCRFFGNHPPCADVLSHAAAALRGDAEVVQRAVARHSDALQHASEALRANTQVLVAAVSSGTSLGRWARDNQAAPHRDISGLRHATPAALGDRDTMAAVVQAEPWAMAYASLALRADKAFVLPLLVRGQGVAWHVHPSLLGDREVALAMAQEGFLPADHPLLGDADFVCDALRTCCTSFVLATPQVRGDRRVALRAFAVRPKGVERGTAITLNHVTGAARTDKDVALAAVRYCGSNVRFLTEELRNDTDVALAVLKDTKNYFAWLGGDARDDYDVAMAAIARWRDSFAFAGPSVRGDRRAALAAFAPAPTSHHLRVKEELLFYASWDLKADREVVFAAVQSNKQNFDHADPSLRHDSQFVASLVTGAMPTQR